MNAGLTQKDFKHYDDILAKANDQQLEPLFNKLKARINKI